MLIRGSPARSMPAMQKVCRLSYGRAACWLKIVTLKLNKAQRLNLHGSRRCYVRFCLRGSASASASDESGQTKQNRSARVGNETERAVKGHGFAGRQVEIEPDAKRCGN